AYIKGIDRLAIKVASGFFENSTLNLPSASGQMLVLSAETGYLKAVLLDNGYLTQVRTGAAGALAAKHLAPKNAENAGVIGSGTQARFQMRGLSLMRKIKTIRMFSLDQEEVKDAYVKDMEAELGVKVIKAESPEEVVRESSVVVTTTPARKGYIKAEWLHPAEVLAKADILACDLKSQVFRLGETRSALEQGVLTEESPIVELGALVNGREKGRSSEEQISVCDLTGVGVQDTMIALAACDLAEAQDMGVHIET
ncbi:MAG: ornithine cyclodeaminase family protein, partial [Sediminispirochaetaceae bacterium]